ncbi:TMV resistance protein N [Helianthus annuus]|uniref:TMV resistance protein N n=1 Tax=Helianthus annuus TaxID=4232 RepID=UPI000B8FF6A3|nr:TMV resistance protein N [Helianthus annuus]
MASSSSHVHNKNYVYDVFLSFSGEDTRKTFVDHLYAALDQQGICTFKDDEKLQKGKEINEELLQSIQDSRCYIIVFSKRYASSSWCLNELLKIMECHKTNEQTAFPVWIPLMSENKLDLSERHLRYIRIRVNQRLENGERHLKKQPICLVGMSGRLLTGN